MQACMHAWDSYNVSTFKRFKGVDSRLFDRSMLKSKFKTSLEFSEVRKACMPDRKFKVFSSERYLVCVDRTLGARPFQTHTDPTAFPH